MRRLSDKSNNHLKGFFTALMIFIYLLAIFQTSGSYFHTHEHDVGISHNAEVEKDACHRTIYHRDLNHGCKHPSHLTKAAKKCSLCEGILFLDTARIDAFAFLLNFYNVQEISSYAPLVKLVFHSEIMNKGPPFKVANSHI
ncbi:MAG: hypothetical protein IPJ53_02460 [Saprospiraceae bacterium]|nr:hypothetical protein [Candidatus Vicinibacter affinis]